MTASWRSISSAGLRRLRRAAACRFGDHGARERAPRLRSVSLRLAVAAIHRPGAVTPSVVLSLGLGLSLLVAIALIDGNLTRQLTHSMPDRAPSFFFLDIPREEAGDSARWSPTRRRMACSRTCR
jgi:putative ABC transport system permease protein